MYNRPNRTYRYKPPQDVGRQQGRITPAEFTSRTMPTFDPMSMVRHEGGMNHSDRETAQKKLSSHHHFPYRQAPDNFHA